MSPIQVLVVDDDEVTCRLLKEVLERDGYSVVTAESGEQAIALIRNSSRARSFPLILSDIRMLELDGLAVLRVAKQVDPRTEVVLMTGFGSMEGAIEAVQLGAFDYVSKPFKIDELKKVLARAASHWKASSAAQGLPQASSESNVPERFEWVRGLIGKSPGIVEVYKTLARAAVSNSPVLITGERGTGKELVARSIHQNSRRKDQPFIAYSCVSGAESPSVQEREMSDCLREAEGGTLFIDELAALKPSVQLWMVRSLFEGETAQRVRVISASREPIGRLVETGQFREDLFYRIGAIRIELPALRERTEDISELAAYFLGWHARRNGRNITRISEEAMELLLRYAWPGNVRELEHAIERAVAMAKASILFPEDFPSELRSPKRPEPGAAAEAAGGPEPLPGGEGSLEELERRHIVRVLQETGFNKSRASEILGIDRATLYRKAQRYGIDLRGGKGSG